MQPYILFIFFAFLIDKSLQESVPQTRIFGGKPAAPGQFPYQVFFVALEGTCGGIIISDRYVLTAAHCVYDGSTQNFYNIFGIVFGTYDLNVTDGVHYVKPETSDFIVHEDYNNTLKLNDIALIKLSSPISFNNLVGPVKLPKRSYDDSYLAGRKIISSGFGLINDNDTSIVSDHLYYMTTTTVPHNECIELYLKENLTDSQYHPDRKICINAHGQSICVGDSGGPNVIKDDSGELVVVGITVGVSTKGCTENKPQILIRISHYLDWIHEKTGIPIEE